MAEWLTIDSHECVKLLFQCLTQLPKGQALVKLVLYCRKFNKAFILTPWAPFCLPCAFDGIAKYIYLIKKNYVQPIHALSIAFLVFLCLFSSFIMRLTRQIRMLLCVCIQSCDINLCSNALGFWLKLSRS